MTITVPLVAALDQAWAAIRSRHPEVPEVVVTIGSGTMGERGAGRYGHFAAARWEHAEADGGELPELFIGGEGLARGAVEVLGTMLHVAAHGIAHARGIKDTSRQGRYHSKAFADLAREVGLEVQQTGNLGWSETRVPTATADQYTDVLGSLGAVLVATRRPEPRSNTTGRTSNNNYVVGVCACPRRIRAAVSVFELGPINCGICSQPFVPLLPEG